MRIDWTLVIAVAVPVGTLFLGAWVQRWFERRPKLQTHYGHVSAFKYTTDSGEKSWVYTHSVVLTNVGLRVANNVRIRHAYLPEFDIFPPVDYRIVDLPHGSKEVLIPALVPKEQITINYLYFPPLTYAGINSGIRSDEGFAQEIPVLLQRQFPAAINMAVALFLLTGLVTALYLLVLLAKWLIS